MHNENEHEYDVKEDFCPSCLVVPLAFAGAGATAAGATVGQKHKKTKKILLISGVITLLFTLGLGVYYIMKKDDCKSCKL